MARSGDPRVSVVVPTCNEARNLELLLPAIAAVRPAVAEVIIADGSSSDGTVRTARRVLPAVKVARQTRTGKGNALACGFAAATGDVIVTFDADGSADPSEIPGLVAALAGGADFVTGSRFLAGGGHPGSSLPSRMRQAVLRRVARAAFGAGRTDLGYGLHAFRTDLLPALDLPSIAAPAAGGPRWGDGEEMGTLLVCRAAAAGARLAEVPSVQRVPLSGRPVRRTAADDRLVLRALSVERRRLRRRAAAAPVERPAAHTPAGGLPMIGRHEHDG